MKSWLDKQGDPNFRLNFFVDEVGQFIGADTKLMLDLQTIAESLNTKCAGRSWVFVTSQEDMEKVIGDRTRQQGNDFSKIQARFKTRLKLTSADVEEVIRKRLLEKNDAGTTALGRIYADQHANFKTLFDFVDGAKTYRNYADEAHFIGTYPFVSYQFPLFQAAIEGISDHNVFEGRNSSVGERSMLGVVQQVAKDIGNVEVGQPRHVRPHVRRHPRLAEGRCSEFDPSCGTGLAESRIGCDNSWQSGSSRRSSS